MTDPARAARLWLALAVATLWLLSVGGAADASVPEGTLPAFDPAALAPPRRRARSARSVSVARRGRALILAALLADAPLPTGRLRPEPWPTRALLPSVDLITSGGPGSNGLHQLKNLP